MPAARPLRRIALSCMKAGAGRAGETGDRTSDTRGGRDPPSRASISLVSRETVVRRSVSPFGRMDGFSGLKLDKRDSRMGSLQAWDRGSSSPVSPLLCFVRSPYVFYTYQDATGTFNRISRFEASGDVAGSEEVLLDRLPANNFHNSGRLGFGPDGLLYTSLGDAGDAAQAQDPQTLPGKILRMHRDGTRPGDNPFPLSYTYLYGIRNVFGFDFAPDGSLFFTENGPRGNDEVNLGLRGENYGWPTVQGADPDPDPRFVPPLAAFTPAIVPTGLAFYTGDRLGPAHSPAAYFGSWNFGRLYRLVENALADPRFHTELALDPRIGGVLDVVDAPDGYLYVSFPDRIARVILEPVSSMAPNPGSLVIAIREARFARLS